MKNYRQRGDAVYVPAASGGWLAGQVASVGGIYGVNDYDVASGAVAVVHRSGIFSLPKATGSDWTAGATIWYDTVSKRCGTASVASAFLIGVAVPTAPNYTAAALSADLFGDVLLK